MAGTPDRRCRGRAGPARRHPRSRRALPTSAPRPWPTAWSAPGTARSRSGPVARSSWPPTPPWPTRWAASTPSATPCRSAGISWARRFRQGSRCAGCATGCGCRTENPYAALDRLAADVPAGSDGLVFLPYLVGERSPIMDPEATGAFMGLTLGHRRAHLARAVLEGVACSLRATRDAVIDAGGSLRHHGWPPATAWPVRCGEASSPTSSASHSAYVDAPERTGGRGGAHRRHRAQASTPVSTRPARRLGHHSWRPSLTRRTCARYDEVYARYSRLSALLLEEPAAPESPRLPERASRPSAPGWRGSA